MGQVPCCEHVRRHGDRKSHSEYLRGYAGGELRSEINHLSLFVHGLRYVQLRQDRHHRSPRRSISNVASWTYPSDQQIVSVTRSRKKKFATLPPEPKRMTGGGLFVVELAIHEEPFRFKDVRFWINLFVVMHCPDE
jgi:hypothetical protein